MVNPCFIGVHGDVNTIHPKDDEWMKKHVSMLMVQNSKGIFLKSSRLEHIYPKGFVLSHFPKKLYNV